MWFIRRHPVRQGLGSTLPRSQGLRNANWSQFSSQNASASAMNIIVPTKNKGYLVGLSTFHTISISTTASRYHILRSRGLRD